MKLKDMKQVVAGLALSAVMLGATAFESHPAAAAAVNEGTMLEKSRGIYRNASEMTAQQKSDLQWYRQTRNELLNKQWQNAVDNGYMSTQGMEARLTLMQEHDKKTLNGKQHKLSYEEREAMKKFAKKYRKANKQEKQAMQAEKLERDLLAGRINKSEYDARKLIMQERQQVNKKQLTAAYKSQRAEFAKQAKELNRAYIKKCLSNGRLTAEQAQKMLTALDKEKQPHAVGYDQRNLQ